MKKVLIGILYNKPEVKENSIDYEATMGVMDEVKAVEESLKILNYDYIELPILSSNTSEIMKMLIEKEWHCIINLCESFNGKNMEQYKIPAVLELLNIPYTGSNSYAILLTTDKAYTKNVLSLNGLPVPRYFTNSDGANLPEDLIFPLIVKPQYEDASVGVESTSVVYNPKELLKEIKRVIDKFNQPAIIEEYINGREINVAIVEDEEINVLPLSEIIFENFPADTPKIVSYKAKWIKDSWEEKQTPAICPAVLDIKIEDYIKEIAIKAFKICKCQDYARVDIRLDERNNPYIIEVNCNPDISPHAGFARSWKASGKNYNDFIKFLIDKAHNKKRAYLRMLNNGW